MSEYQYYEFQAIDRPLTREEMAEMRSCSSRARITSARFTNEYHWGDFKGDTRKWMERYFDAHLYTSNFGSRVFCLRFPIGWIERKKITPYQVEGALEVTTTRSHLILDFNLDSEPGEYDEDEDNDGLLTSLLAIRRALVAGDFRALYIGWLAGLQNGLVEQDSVEPPVPAGLGDMDEALNHLTAFLNVPEDLVAATALQSLPISPGPTKKDLQKWLADIGSAEKESWLAEILSANDPSVACNILNHYRASTSPAEAGSHPLRTAGDILAEAENLEKRRLDRERQEFAKKERARILALAGQKSGLWQSVIKLSDSSSANYQGTAIRTLGDLRDLAELTESGADFREKLESLIELRRRKSAFMKRLQEAGFA